jgi:uncharacterized delta-60 repeat protein
MKSRSTSVRPAPQLTDFHFAFRQFACALLLGGSLSAVPALGSPGGELDPAFGDHGRILLHESEFEEFRGVDVFLDSGSGRLLAVASGYYNNALLGFNGDGSPDQAFGNQGAVPLDFGDDSLDILDVERLADGRLLIAGVMNAFGDPNNVIHGSALLARMHADGTPDESFGSSGRATFQLGGVYESLSEIMMQADGRIVVLGSTNRTGSIERILARYTKDGSPDASFGNSATPGISVVDLAGIDENLPAIVQQSDGKFLACGNATSKTDSSASSEVLAVRIRPDGVGDSAFGNNGMVSIGGWQESVEIDDCLELVDGHLIFAGSSGSSERQRAAALRLTPDGRLDAAFGDNGMVVLDTDLPSAATAMLVMSDGSLAIAGTHSKTKDGRVSWADMLVARIDPISGAIDRGFGDRGVATVDFGSRGHVGVAVPARLRQQPDGKLVVIGSQVDRYDWYYAFSVAITRIDPYGSGSNGWASLTDAYETVPPEGDTVALHLRRTGGSTGQLSVNYRTVNGTATAGVHYVASSGTVAWSDGDLSEKTLSISVLNSEPVADWRDFNVELFNSSGGLAMDQVTISISPSESSSGSPPPDTPPPGGGTNGGGGAIGIEIWFLIVLAAVFAIARFRRGVRLS